LATIIYHVLFAGTDQTFRVHKKYIMRKYILALNLLIVALWSQEQFL